MTYFYSHLILNSLFYISHDNILNLDHSSEALFAPYELETTAKPRVRSNLLVIRYADAKRAMRGLDRFIEAYVPEHQQERSQNGKKGNRGQAKIEDGWLGYLLKNRCLVLIFTHPHPESLQAVMDQVPLNKL